ncbi:hypothetical protein BKA70DRAFT_1424199 [Coprinopsis sp. MPI-PUGE-AT-0042]|nr:hypothetical protein BKA70DRAFT_1424199 [Coprinopsis sp. MPI-PUGE-AT-0042]
MFTVKREDPDTGNVLLVWGHTALIPCPSTPPPAGSRSTIKNEFFPSPRMSVPRLKRRRGGEDFIALQIPPLVKVPSDIDIKPTSLPPEHYEDFHSEELATAGQPDEDISHVDVDWFDWSQDDQRLNRWEYLHEHPSQDVSATASVNADICATSGGPGVPVNESVHVAEPDSDALAVFDLAEIEHRINSSFASPPLLQHETMAGTLPRVAQEQLARYTQRRRTLRAIDAKEREIYETKQRLSALLRERTDYDVFMAMRGLMIA